jgi:hypothetical protein
VEVAKRRLAIDFKLLVPVKPRIVYFPLRRSCALIATTTVLADIRIAATAG